MGKKVYSLGRWGGIVFEATPSALAGALLLWAVLTVAAGDNMVRFLPPLIIDESHVDEALAILEDACVAAEAAAG